MKMLNTFFQICIYFCIITLVFTLAINVVSAWNLFVTVDSGIQTAEQSDNILAVITGFSGGMEIIWTFILTIGGISSIIVAKFLQNSSIIGVWLLSSVMWTSYFKTVTVVDINNWIPSDIILIFTTAILFIWVAAIIGMLSRSG
ncbi:unnamed protein product [marine sediment metagenome]|uniref:Uncharacterized protein n=1 Tax=marine sediment metagenome TaxID=412755 RepID=X1E4L1_9ZZZZ